MSIEYRLEVLNESMSRMAHAMERCAIAMEGLRGTNSDTAVVDEMTQEDIEAARKVFTDAYNLGRVVEVRDAKTDDEPMAWYGIHIHQSPHKFDFDKNIYRLPPKRK